MLLKLSASVLLSLLSALFVHTSTLAQVKRVKIGVASEPASAEVQMKLKARFQHLTANTADPNDHFDEGIYSPKSAIFTPDGKKFYINSLEGFSTLVYDATTLKRTKIISHTFNSSNQSLFLNGETTAFDYAFKKRTKDQNYFQGKPVESCLSHNGRYLWVTYYRRSYDMNAQDPSAVAIIDTQTDEIVRVMPTGPLPKMVAASPDGRYVAVTHWGDNTVGLIDVSTATPKDFKYVKHFVVGKRLSMDFSDTEKIDRDKECGYCLRGTTFTPDSKYLLVGRMTTGGIAVFDMQHWTYIGLVTGMKGSVRHLIIRGSDVLVSTNSSGYVHKLPLKTLLDAKVAQTGKDINLVWEGCFAGNGIRTIDSSPDAEYIFAAVNNESKIAVIRTSDMSVIASIAADSFPVGLAVSPDSKLVVVTAQGKSAGGGNSVMVYAVEKK